jgi:hypothetical protein
MPISQGESRPEQRLQHWNTSVTPERFVQHTRGKTLEQLRAESSFSNEVTDSYARTSENGPEASVVYVKDPLDPAINGQPGGVIDMKHFIAAATTLLSAGEYTGAVVEYDQQRRGFDSAHFQEDYKSNFLGVVFRNNYLENDNDVSNEFNQFFQDYEKGELKGFWPAVDRTIAALQQMGAQGLEQLGQLTQFVTDYAAHMGQQGLQHLENFRRSLEQIFSTNPSDGIRQLIDQVSLAEQALVAQQDTLQQERVEVAKQPVSDVAEHLEPSASESTSNLNSLSDRDAVNLFVQNANPVLAGGGTAQDAIFAGYQALDTASENYVATHTDLAKSLAVNTIQQVEQQQLAMQQDNLQRTV